jgi:CHASE2 domain-containing sensor protein
MLLYAKKFPTASFVIDTVSSDKRPIAYGRLTPALVTGTFTLSEFYPDRKRMTSSKRKQQTRIGLILGAMIMAYICYALIPEKFQVLDSKIIDRLFVLRSQAKPIHQRIEDRIVHIDANFYFSRSQHARILRNLSAMGVTAQLIDFQFVEMVSQEEDQPLIQATRETGIVRLFSGGN